MRIAFENFGPVAKGELDLRPLTVLIGPNQAGKSFVAMATHSLLRALHRSASTPWLHGVHLVFDQSGYRYYSKHPKPSAAVSKLHERLQRLEPNDLISVSANELADLEQLTPIGLLRELIKSNCEDVFAVPTSTLVRHKSGDGSLTLRSEEWTVSLDLRTGSVTTSFGLTAVNRLHIGYLDRRRKSLQIPEDGQTIAFRPSDQEKHADLDRFLVDLGAQLRRLVAIPRFPDRNAPFYLPAIRSGLLLSHRLFLSLLVRNVQRIGLEPFSVPQMTGVTADFLQSLLRLPDEPETTAARADLVDRFEKEITGGRVYLKKHHSDTLPAYQFKTASGLDIPLNLASSTVTEVAPIFLSLRHHLSRHAWLIIEEPESHLSPDNQALMARFLSALVNSGLRVLITTHSSFLLEQLNNLIVAHAAGDRAGGSALDPDKVAAHQMVMDSVASGSELRLLSIDPSSGIDLSTILTTYESIYNENFRLKQQLDQNRSV